MVNEANIFNRAELLLGSEGLERVAHAKVLIVGVGGVGSWCAESLIRTGIQHLTIVDSDVVCPSNINRQLMATTQTVGQVKVEALKKRLLQINPQAEINAIQKVYNEESAHAFNLDEYDYVVDAIDSLKDKALLILKASASKAKLFSSMGAALKLDPTRIQVAEFWKVMGDPLAKALRNKFKKSGEFPKKKFKCVYSEERLQNLLPGNGNENAEKRVNGSIVHITAIFGFTLAGLIIQDINK